MEDELAYENEPAASSRHKHIRAFIIISAVVVMIIAVLTLISWKHVIPGNDRKADFTFGSYEQDNDLSNGPEPIEWIVLSRENGKAFVISKYALDAQAFDLVYDEGSNWAISDIRTWLNNDFLDTAFSEAEQAQILPSDGDQISLLSMGDLKHYFWTHASRVCQATSYAKAQSDAHVGGCFGSFVDGETMNCGWWLQSNGTFDNSIASICFDGRFACIGNLPEAEPCCVRPVMWIDSAVIS